jgi:hypothetical protein
MAGATFQGKCRSFTLKSFSGGHSGFLSPCDEKKPLPSSDLIIGGKIPTYLSIGQLRMHCSFRD